MPPKLTSRVSRMSSRPRASHFTCVTNLARRYCRLSMSGVTNFPSSAWSNRPTSRRSRAGRGEFLDFDPEFEMGHWVAAAPSVDFPARLKELDVSDLANVERGGPHGPVRTFRVPGP